MTIQHDRKTMVSVSHGIWKNVVFGFASVTVPTLIYLTIKTRRVKWEFEHNYKCKSQEFINSRYAIIGITATLRENEWLNLQPF